MTTRELSDLIFTPFQDECGESIDPPWAIEVEPGRYRSRFEDERIGDVLYIREIDTGECFTVTVAKGKA